MKHTVKRDSFLLIFLMICLLHSAAYAGTIEGTLLEDTGEPVEGIPILIYEGEDPERYTAYPDEIGKAIRGRTEKNGNFSINVPARMKTFNLKVKVDTTYYYPIELKHIPNQEGTFSLPEKLLVRFIDNEPFWVTSDDNSRNPNTLSVNTNRWEQIKARGKSIPIYFPPVKFEPLFVTPVEGKTPELRGLPVKKTP
ncbi:MAG: hypothetical protein RDV48_13540 [Candidatus Eremiobacteraeota bacterium]|nr:hypothetical protein [Candidatus Eremiobacteraeota bacterium]